ncbi:hypothetical protein [Flavobacterium sp. XS2P14]|uniref:hypothetical protein n=1 Tax=Flavobacterium sp. XS2P14 TaxID=3401735 RepID=UPI003AAB3F17
MNEYFLIAITNSKKNLVTFFGAMNIDYGLTVAQGIATYVIAKFFFKETFDLRIIPIIAMVIFAMASTNIRLSRLF